MSTLLTYATANGQRASIALEECGLEYKVKSVDLIKGEHRGDEFLALNPFGRIPVYQPDGGDAIYGSLAIGMHAANATGRLLPSDDDRDAFHHWLGIIMTDLAPAYAAQFYLGMLAPEPDEWSLNFYLDVIRRFMSSIDDHLAGNEHFLPGGYSLADVMMYPAAASSATRLPEKLEPWPNIAAWAERIGARGAVQRGMAASGELTD